MPSRMPIRGRKILTWNLPRLPMLIEARQAWLHRLWPQASARSGILECPITGRVLRDPVVAADGFTYEREAIQRHLQTKKRSPVTGEALPHATLWPNVSVRVLLR